jgi:small subunit ribosomal protein S9
MTQTRIQATTKKKLEYQATGKRKNSIARVRLLPGTGTITVNDRPYNEYFPRPTLQMTVNRPFEISQMTGKYDAVINVAGGGIAGQAGAVRHGISKALLAVDGELRKSLKGDGLLTRDAREKERRKVGRRKARRRPQYSKR